MRNPPEHNLDREGILLKLRDVLAEPDFETIRDFVRILRDSVDHYNWVGVYLVKDEKLVLAGFSGDSATEHVTIPIGEGICGSAAELGETIIVPDVNKDSRYLACFASTRSEIVVPIQDGQRVIGEIDIDSDRLAAFDENDRELLERAAQMLADCIEKFPALKKTPST